MARGREEGGAGGVQEDGRGGHAEEGGPEGGSEGVEVSDDEGPGVGGGGGAPEAVGPLDPLDLRGAEVQHRRQHRGRAVRPCGYGRPPPAHRVAR